MEHDINGDVIETIQEKIQCEFFDTIELYNFNVSSLGERCSGQSVRCPS